MKIIHKVQKKQTVRSSNGSTSSSKSTETHLKIELHEVTDIAVWLMERILNFTIVGPNELASITNLLCAITSFI